MIDTEHTPMTLLSGISLEQARDARARAWAFVFQCWQEKQMATEPAAEPDGRNGVSIRNRKEVSDVDRQSDRSSDDHIARSTLVARHLSLQITRGRKKDSQDQEAQEPPRKGPINGSDKEN
jgi:hypothetical protein